jgi:hypothetical protein
LHDRLISDIVCEECKGFHKPFRVEIKFAFVSTRKDLIVMLLTMLQCLGVWFMVSVPSSLLIGAILARRGDKAAARPALREAETGALTSGYEPAQ